jgi:hypothetical protein
MSCAEVQKQNTQIYSQQYMPDKLLYLQNNFVSNLLIPSFDMSKFILCMVVEVKEVYLHACLKTMFVLSKILIVFLHYFRPEILQ